MPCFTVLKPQQTKEQREKEVRERLAKIEQMLGREVTLKVGPQGAVTLLGLSEEDRDGLTDTCILRKLATSPALRQAKLRAEAMSGFKVNERVIEAGIHSHDGGRTWHPAG